MTVMSKLFKRGLLKGGLLAQSQGYNVVAYPNTGNTVTVKLYPCTLAFRNPDPRNGRAVFVDQPDVLTLTIPSGASCGAYAAFPVRLLVLALYNGGNPILAVSNRLNINTPFDETGLVTASVISAGSTSRDAVYAMSAVSAATPYKVVGLIDTTQATAGVYVSPLSLVTGVTSPLSVYKPPRRVWNAVTGSRSLAVPYTNRFNYEIKVKAFTSEATSRSLYGYVDGQLVDKGVNADFGTINIQIDVPPGSTYQISGTDAAYWGEYY